MASGPIFLAEDSATLRRAYSESLEAVGYKVMAADDGDKVLTLLHRVPHPMLIILDVMMPRMGGIQTCQNIRKMQGSRTCPILFLTALDTPLAMLDCLKAGGDDFLIKSQPVEKIIERVSYWARQDDTEKNAERRKRAVRELEAMIDKSEEERRRLAKVDDPESEPTLKKLVDYITQRMKDFPEQDEIHRFGYLVGLFEAYAPFTIKDKQAFHFFLKKLVFMTNFLDTRSVDSLLDSYQRVTRQGQFRTGWTAGRNDASQVNAQASPTPA